jgi:hypothetical protein
MGCTVSSKENDARFATKIDSSISSNLAGDQHEKSKEGSASDDIENLPELKTEPALIETPDIESSVIDDTTLVAESVPPKSIVIYDKDILSAAELLGLDPTLEGELMWIAERFAHATVSPPWVTFVDQVLVENSHRHPTIPA